MFDLTPQERKSVLFLACIVFIGLTLRLVSKFYTPVKHITSLSLEAFGKIDINTADKELLVSVPGIGNTLAERIIKYREENSGFKALEEMRLIKGITRYRFDKLKEHLIAK